MLAPRNVIRPAVKRALGMALVSDPASNWQVMRRPVEPGTITFTPDYQVARHTTCGPTAARDGGTVPAHREPDRRSVVAVRIHAPPF